MNRKKGTIIAALLGIPLLMGLGAGVGIVVVTQLGFVKSSNTDESEKSSDISESATSTTSSDPEAFYIGKGSDGSRIYIKPEDVSCKTSEQGKKGETDSLGYRLNDWIILYCTANGYYIDLADQKKVFRDDSNCASTGSKRKRQDGTVFYSSPAYNSNTSTFGCVAAEKYGKYRLQDFPSGNYPPIVRQLKQTVPKIQKGLGSDSLLNPTAPTIE